MTTYDALSLTDEEEAALLRLLRRTTGETNFPFADKNRVLRTILAKVAPPVVKPLDDPVDDDDDAEDAA